MALELPVNLLDRLGRRARHNGQAMGDVTLAVLVEPADHERGELRAHVREDQRDDLRVLRRKEAEHLEGIGPAQELERRTHRCGRRAQDRVRALFADACLQH